MAVGIKGTFTGGASGILYTDRRRFNLSDEVHELLQDEGRFLTVLSKSRREPTDDPDFKLFEHSPGWLDRRFYLNGTPPTWSGTAAGSTASAIGVQATVNGSNNVGFLIPGLVVNTLTGTNAHNSRWLVTAVNSQQSVDGKLLGPALTSTGDFDDNDPSWIVGSAFEEGGGAAEATSDEVTAAYGSTQIFKTAFGVTGTMNATRLYGGAERARLRGDKFKEHKLDINRGLIFGARVGNRETADAHLQGTTHKVRTTDGFIRIMEYMNGADASYTYKQSITMSTFTYDLFVDAIAETFYYGSKTKLALCGAGVLGYFSKLGTSGFLGESQIRLPIEPGGKLVGVDIKKIITPHGTLILDWDPCLRGGSADGNYENYMMVIDLPNISYRPLIGAEDRDTHLDTAIQNPGEDKIKDQYLTEAGLGLKNPKTHQLWVFA